MTRKPRLSGAFRPIGAPRFELGTSSPPDFSDGWRWLAGRGGKWLSSRGYATLTA